MPENIGEHLLGRKPFVADERDFRLENFLALIEPVADPAADATALIDDALAELRQTQYSYIKWAATVYKDPTVTHWWKALADLAAAQQILNPAPTPSGGIIWADPEPVLDQGDEGTCVGFGCAQWGNTLPVDDRWGYDVGRAIYYEATVLDGYPDDTYQQGATVRSGVKALKNRGRLTTYALTTSTATITAWIKAKGSVICGTDWTNGMFNPDSNGYVTPTGGVAGGHCYLLDEWQPAGQEPEHYGFLNSWGAGWGDQGRFYMTVSDFGKLLQAQGEAWTAVELAL